MEIPSEFLVKSTIGVFRMRCRKNVGEKMSYEGTANGFDCKILLNFERLEYSVFLSSDSDRWGFAETSSEGKSMTFDGMLSEIGIWMESVCVDLTFDNERDVKYFQTSNGKIAYYAYNTELEGTPVLMVHGGPGGDSNTERARKLMLDRPVYLYDQLGCGRSDKIPNIAEWNDVSYMKEMKEFIDGMGFDKVIFVAASWGSGLSVEYAIETMCEKVALLILPSPFLSSARWSSDQQKNMKNLPAEYQKEMNECLADFDRKKYCHVMEEYYKRYLFARKCNSEIAVSAANEEMNEVFLALWGPNDLECTGTLRNFNLIPRLGEITVNTLLMCGDTDEVTPETMIEYSRLIKNSRLSIIPNAGHALAFEQPDMFRQTIVDYLKECGY